jgi:ribosomal protein S27E
MSGYTNCACRDCFDTTVSSDASKPELCSECADAGCEPTPFGEPMTNRYLCQRDDAYMEA